MSTGATPYDTSKSYAKGSLVTLNGIVYEAKWWAGAGSSPDQVVKNDWDSPWRKVSESSETKTDSNTASTTKPSTSEPTVDPNEKGTDLSTGQTDITTQDAAHVDVSYGAVWGTNPTSSVQFKLSEDLNQLVLRLPTGTIHDVLSPWGATVEKTVENNMDKLVFTKMPTITYEVTTFGFNLSLNAGKSFDAIQVSECLFNDRQCTVTFMETPTPGQGTETTGTAVDPFPKRVLNDAGHFVQNVAWTSAGTTYKTYKRPTYSAPEGDHDFMVGGYFTDWGVYSGFSTSRLPINNINFIQLAFAGICGPGDETNWFGNESATAEAKPKLLELCKNKPVGTVIILDEWSHYGKKDTNLPEWMKPYAEPAYHVDGYERSLNLFGFGNLDEYPIHNKGGVQLVREGKLNYAYGIQNDLRSYNQALNRNGRKFHMFLSIGGWTLSDPFPEIAANPTFRKNFIDSCIGYLSINSHINGIDIDWEFPGVDGAKPGIMKARDTDNYTIFMSELRHALNKLGQQRGTTYYLSSAIGTAPAHLEKIHWESTVINGSTYPGMKDILDHIFMMSYDYYGPWGSVIGHQSALFPNSEIAGYSCSSGVEFLKSKGVNSRKIIMGVAAYGRIWKNATESDLNRSGKYTFPNQGTGQSPGNIGSQAAVVYWHHLKRCAYDKDGNLKDGYRWVRDEKAKAEMLMFEDTESGTNFVTTVDTPYSVTEKAKYVKTHNLGGLFYWTLDNDNGDLLNAIHEGLGSKWLSDSLEPNYRENSLLLYRVKEANYGSNPNVKQRYALGKINDVIGNLFTFGGLGILDAFRSLMALPKALAESKSVQDLTDKEWEEYVQLLKSEDQYGSQMAGLTIDAARAAAENAGATLGYTAFDVLFDPPFLTGLGMAMTAGLQDVILDSISPHSGGDYVGRIIRDTINPWDQMRKDIPSITYNY